MTSHASTGTARPIIALALAAVLVLFGLQGALAAVSPPGCTSNNWGFDVDKNFAVVHIGDTISYTVHVTNGGAGACDVTDASVTFTYPDGAVEVLATNASYPADGSGDATFGPFTYLVTKADADAEGGGVVTARVEGSGTVQDSDAGSGVNVFKDVGTIVWQPGVSVEKTASVAEAAPGDEVVFTIVITNTGNAPLETVGLEDSMFGSLAGLGCDYVSPTFLNPGQSCTITIPYTVQESDPDPLHNVATVTFQDPLYTDGSTVTATDDATVPRPGTTEPVPGITIEKGPDYQEIVVSGGSGGTPSAAGAACSSEFDGKGTKKGKIRTYYFVFEDGTVATGTADSNEAEIAGFGEPFHVSCSDPFPGGYGLKGSPTAPEPALVWWAIWFDDQPYDVWSASGAASTKIENGEIGTTMEIMVGDAVVTITAWIPKEDDPGDWIGFSYEIDGYLASLTVKAGTETFTIEDPGTSGTWIHPGGTFGPDAKGISYVLFVEGEGPASGEAFFTITVTNTGETDLFDVDVTDPLAPDCEAQLGYLDESGNRVFPVGATVTYECSVPDVTAGFTNVATAAGTAPDGSPVDDSDDAVVAVIVTGPGEPPDPDPDPEPEYPSSDGAMCSSDFEGKGNGKGKLRAYWFVFADGTEISGTAEGNEVAIEGFAEPFHISCSDPFPGGYGEKGAPTAPEPPLAWWAIWRYDADEPVPPVPDPSPDPDPDPQPEYPSSEGATCSSDFEGKGDGKGKLRTYWFVFADGTEISGTAEGNEVAIEGFAEPFHISCSDRFAGGYGEKGAPTAPEPPLVWWAIWRYGPDDPVPPVPPAPGDPDPGDPDPAPGDPDPGDPDPAPGDPDPGVMPGASCEVVELPKPKKDYKVTADDVVAAFVAGGPYGGMVYLGDDASGKLDAPAMIADPAKTHDVAYVVLCTGDADPGAGPGEGPIPADAFRAWTDGAGYSWTGEIPDAPEVCEVVVLDKPKGDYHAKGDDLLAVFVAGGPDGGMSYFQQSKYDKLEAPLRDGKKTYKVEYVVECRGDEAPSNWPAAGPITITEFHAWAATAGFEWAEE